MGFIHLYSAFKGILFDILSDKKPMNTINTLQAQNILEDLYGAEVTQKMREVTEKVPICLFCTNIASHRPFSTRPMSVQQLDENGCFWFLSAINSFKNME